MTRVTSSKYHALEIQRVTITFIDGQAEIDDPEVLRALASLNPAFGITVHDDATAPEPDRDAPDDQGRAPGSSSVDRPAGNASRDDWAAYANILGVDAPEGATRSEIQTAVNLAIS